MNGLGRVGGLVWVLIWLVSGAQVWAFPAAQSGQRLAYGQTVEGFIGDEQEEQRWVFSGVAGDVVLIDMLAMDMMQLDTLLTLLDGDGNTLVTDDDGGLGLNSRIGPYTLPADGDYVIVAGRYSGSGDYRLRLSSLNTAPTLRLGKILRGAVGGDTAVEYYRLQAEADEPQLVRLALSPQADPLGYQIMVYGPDGQRLMVADPSEGGVTLLLMPETRDTVAVAQSEDGEGGAYTLTLTPSDEELLRDDVPQRGGLDALTTEQRHYFVGQRDDVVRVTLEAEDGFLPAFYIGQQGGEDLLFSADGGAMKRISATLTLPADGAYVVGVYPGQFTPMEGDYTLTVSWQSR